jgi:hypothetical protein
VKSQMVVVRSREDLVNLVVAQKPETWCLVVLVVGNHDVVSSYLEEVSACGLDLATGNRFSNRPMT